MNIIHPTALVHEKAKLGEQVTVGAFCVVGEGAELGNGVTLHSHVVIMGDTHLGDGVVVYPFASIGHAPQDLKFKGEPSRVVIGARTILREHVTINPGTEGGGLLTSVGNDSLLMVGVHIAHDCRVGHHVIMANNATLAGHVHVGNEAVLGGLCAVHQFVRIGRGAMIGGLSGVERDVIPYGTVMGNRARLAGLNLVGLKRRGAAREDIHALRHAYQRLFEQEGTLAANIEALVATNPASPYVQEVLTFLRTDSTRAFCVTGEAS
jgi:UDP-N-acetylglucosamine acyltransferase